ncbi:MAG: sigma-70 family RNA polymerase sigma factor, partial [Lachnospiraceae bacterium]|nr:sigma-70 family RNA polymerase sigma factor [Lachnospiraceae bacterium]
EQGNEIRSSVVPGYMRVEPEAAVEEKELKEALMEALEALTEKEKTVVLLYYYEELTLKEISNVMDVSESRVSQLHSKALKKMRGYLGEDFAVLMG